MQLCRELTGWLGLGLGPGSLPDAAQALVCYCRQRGGAVGDFEAEGGMRTRIQHEGMYPLLMPAVLPLLTVQQGSCVCEVAVRSGCEGVGVLTASALWHPSVLGCHMEYCPIDSLSFMWQVICDDRRSTVRASAVRASALSILIRSTTNTCRIDVCHTYLTCRYFCRLASTSRFLAN